MAAMRSAPAPVPSRQSAGSGELGSERCAEQGTARNPVWSDCRSDHVAQGVFSTTKQINCFAGCAVSCPLTAAIRPDGLGLDNFRRKRCYLFQLTLPNMDIHAHSPSYRIDWQADDIESD